MKLVTALTILLSTHYAIRSPLSSTIGFVVIPSKISYYRSTAVAAAFTTRAFGAQPVVKNIQSNRKNDYHHCARHSRYRTLLTRPLNPLHCLSSIGILVGSSGGATCGGVQRGTKTPTAASLMMALSRTTTTDAAVTAKQDTEAATTATSQQHQQPVEVFRKDYAAPANWVTSIDMEFVLRPGQTIVTSYLTVEPNPTSPLQDNSDLVLDGDETSVSLQSISVNDKELVKGVDYVVEPGRLRIRREALGLDNDGTAKTRRGTLKTVVSIIPENNTQLSGLYKSGSMYCSQCEAHGFRRITYYPDRPDNMATFTRVRIEADKGSYPILLSNGNLVASGHSSEEEGRHYAVWTDPFPKPSYLFCMVAGNLGSITDSYRTRSGRKVHLEIFSEHDNVSKLTYAMESLKKAMKWDEDKFGLEYDLDVFNIVAVNDFNMGAMENKGLNVFNTAYVLADPNTATDVDYERVEGVIGHEYFHNWTGNRVTCRDWFQLTLKEGLTVFRDQEFSGDMGSNAVKRIETVRALRGRQFAEDAGPMAHPIRPESYISMDNFYTATVYSKGAEVIRMYQTLLSPQGFRKGMDLYFKRHDGSAVTCDDFRAAMADANGVDLTQFERWYSTPGTPSVLYDSAYDTVTGTLTLHLTQQKSRMNNEDAEAPPLHIPIAVGLLDKVTGNEVVPTRVLELKEHSQTFEFTDLKGDVVPSILRDFSAPVKLRKASGNDDDDEKILSFLAAYDTDGFNKWEAGQKLFTSLIFKTLRRDDNTASSTSQYVFEAFGRTLADTAMTDLSIKAYALTLPSEAGLAEEMTVIDPAALRAARKSVKRLIGMKFRNGIQTLYNDLTAEMEAEADGNGHKEFQVDAMSIGRRRLRNVMLEYLCAGDNQAESADLAKRHYRNAAGLTDKMAAVQAVASMDGKGAAVRDELLRDFYDSAKNDPLVLDKWFMVQALADRPDVLTQVLRLTLHPDFTFKNPNRCRSLLSAFTMNLASFHEENGKGYEFIAEKIAELDQLNPQVSSRMASSLIQWRRYDDTRAGHMKAQLQKLLDMKPISNDLYEIVKRGLK